MRFEKHGAAQFWFDGENGGVESLEMAGLQDAVAFGGAGQKIVGLIERSGQRLFDKQVQARIQQRRSYGVVMDCGNGDRGRVELEIGGEQIADGSKDRDGVFCSGLCRAD